MRMRRTRGEEYPALVADALGARTSDAYANDVGGRVEERLAHLLQRGVVHYFCERVECHGVDEVVVANDGACRLLATIEQVLLHNQERFIPSLSCAVLEAALILTTAPWSPNRVLLGGNVLATAIQIPPVPPWAGKRNMLFGPQVPATLLRIIFLVRSFTSGLATRSPIQETFIYIHSPSQRPLYLVRLDTGTIQYLCGRNSPDLEIVRPHENLCDARPDIANIPLVKVARLVGRRAHAGLESRINHALHAIYFFIRVEHGNVVLERVGHPLPAEAHVGHALVLEPVCLFGEGLVQDVVKVLVV